MKQWMQCMAVATLALGSAVAMAQNSEPAKDDLFAGTEIFSKGASDITEVTMNPDTLDMVTGRDGKKAHSMVLNVVRTYTYDKPGMYKPEDVDAFRSKLNSSDWYCSVHTRSLKTGDSTDVCNKRRNDDLVETAIITVSPKSLTFVHIIRKKGDWDHSELGASVGVFGLGRLPALAMLDMHAMPNIDVNVDLAVDAAMNTVRSQNWDEMERKLKDEMKEFNQEQRPLLREHMAEEREKAKEDARKQRDEMRSQQKDETPSTPKQPE